MLVNSRKFYCFLFLFLYNKGVMKKETKDKIGKLYPIFLPPVVLIAGILATIFFFVGPVGKGQWDILAIGIIAMVLGLATFIVLLVEIRKKK